MNMCLRNLIHSSFEINDENVYLFTDIKIKPKLLKEFGFKIKKIYSYSIFSKLSRGLYFLLSSVDTIRTIRKKKWTTMSLIEREIKKNKRMQKKKDESKKSEEEENDENKEKEKDREKKDDSQNDESSNQQDKNDSKNNDDGPTDNQNSKSPDQQNEQNREIQSRQTAENILNAIKENEKVNKKRKQTNYSNESGKDW